MFLEAGETQAHFELRMQILSSKFSCLLDFFLCFTFQNTNLYILFYHLSLKNFAISTFTFLLFLISTTKVILKKLRRKTTGVSLTKYFSFLSTSLFIVPAEVFIAFVQEENVAAKSNLL